MPARRADPRQRWRIVLALWLGFATGPLAAAAETEASARAVAARYFAAHNAHHLDDVMALYAENSRFTLSMGRGTVVGTASLRNLELFDAMAGSVLHPFGASFEAQEDGWHMHLAGVLESSSIFRAMGLYIVRTQPIRSTFVIRDGHITAVIQPELMPACSRTMVHGLDALTDWLKSSQNPFGDILLHDGRLDLRATNVAETIATINAWRAKTGWQPEPADAAQCAGADFYSTVTDFARLRG
ncbi:MAG: hypothetical protein H7268_07255 [Sandarakinorhabdus sp.]|nr:hypothetical protein [Sandarakinorhabdus sp.]